MENRLFASLLLIAFVLGGVGCAAKGREMFFALMPEQTGSRIQRRVAIEKPPEIKPKHRQQKSVQAVHSETEPAERPEPESTPPERFR